MEAEAEQKAGRDLKIELKTGVEIDIVILLAGPLVVIGDGAAGAQA